METSSDAPVIIVREQTRVTSGPEVQQKIIHACRALASILRGTLGPRGLDKGLYKSNGEFAITSDGARIINDLLIKNPGAKLLVSLGKSQESVIGDGVTTTVLFAGALLDEAGRLLRTGVHPLVIVDGYQTALSHALTRLDELEITVTGDDRDMLTQVACTALSGRVAAAESEMFSTMIVDALDMVTQQQGDSTRCEAEDVLFAKSEEGALSDSRLIRGVVWKKRIPLARMAGERTDVRIAVLHADLKPADLRRDAEIEFSEVSAYEEFIAVQEQTREQLAECLLASGADLFCCSGEVDRSVLHKLATADALVIADLDEQQLRQVAQASGANVVEHITDLGKDDLGWAASVNAESRQETDEVQDRIIIDGCEGPLVTCSIAGTASVEEVIRGLYDALRATSLTIREGAALTGAGSAHMAASLSVIEAAEAVGDRTRLGIEAYSRALEVIPWTLASNAGADALDALLELRASQRKAGPATGIRADGTVGDVSDVLEPAQSIIHSLAAATETACCLLRCDQVISARGD